MKKLLCITLCLACVATAALAQPTNALPFTRVEDVIYGRKSGTALTLDVFRPAKTNGFGIVMMVSGGWFSSHEGISPAMFQPLLNRGYTVFAVVHGSQPKFTITEIVPDIHRAIRYIRHHAAEYGIDPNQLGITGGSAGGHLSLTMAVQGGLGDPNAKDVLDRESSAVQPLPNPSVKQYYICNRCIRNRRCIFSFVHPLGIHQKLYNNICHNSSWQTQ